MWKIRRKVTKITKGENQLENVYDQHLSEVKELMLSLSFGVAQLLKLTPKQLAKAISKDQSKWAGKFYEELTKAEAAMIQALNKSLNKKK